MSPLSQSDVARLLTTRPAHLPTAATLGQDDGTAALSTHEAQIAEDIVRRLAHGIETTVRANLSRTLRHSSQVPYDVAMRLARDIERVALPMMAYATALTPDDVVDIIRFNSPASHESVTGHSHSAGDVADERITIAHISAVSTLLPYPTAQRRESGFAMAGNRLAGPDVIARIVRPERVPVVIAERLVALAADHLKTYLVSHHALAPDVAADIAVQTRDITIINLSNACPADDLGRLAEEMLGRGRLTPFLALRALCMGDMAFFAAALACMADVPSENARLLIQDPGPTGLRSLFDKSGLPARLFPAMRVAVDVANDLGLDGATRDPERYRVRVITRVLAEFEQFGERDRRYLANQLIAVLTFVPGQGAVAATVAA